ncbi:MAG: hypothetical protein EA418_00680 [Wenzhouxiangellaceae bacterium]|nr:MAG: hypothetical protein EA418_00680 [Wenzhouxiangellaceae bacterium]
MQDRRLIGYSIAASALTAGSAGAEIQEVGTFIIEGSTGNPAFSVLSASIDLNDDGSDNFSVFGYIDFDQNSGYVAISPRSNNYVASESVAGGYVVSNFGPGDTIDSDLTFGDYSHFFVRDWFGFEDDYEPFLNQRGFFGFSMPGADGGIDFACVDFQLNLKEGAFSAEIRGGLINTESGEAAICPDFADVIFADRLEQND